MSGGSRNFCREKCQSPNLYLPPANEVWGKVIFSVACVKNSVYGVGGLPQCMLGYPPTRHPQGPGQGTPPPSSVCWEIRSTSGRYASYWNAILFCRIVQEAVECLNTLQSNAAVLEKVKQERRLHRERNLPETLEFAERLGITVSQLCSYHPIRCII